MPQVPSFDPIEAYYASILTWTSTYNSHAFCLHPVMAGAGLRKCQSERRFPAHDLLQIKQLLRLLHAARTSNLASRSTRVWQVVTRIIASTTCTSHRKAVARKPASKHYVVKVVFAGVMGAVPYIQVGPIMLNLVFIVTGNLEWKIPATRPTQHRRIGFQHVIKPHMLETPSSSAEAKSKERTSDTPTCVFERPRTAHDVSAGCTDGSGCGIPEHGLFITPQSYTSPSANVHSDQVRTIPLSPGAQQDLDADLAACHAELTGMGAPRSFPVSSPANRFATAHEVSTKNIPGPEDRTPGLEPCSLLPEVQWPALTEANLRSHTSATALAPKHTLVSCYQVDPASGTPPLQHPTFPLRQPSSGATDIPRDVYHLRKTRETVDRAELAASLERKETYAGVDGIQLAALLSRYVEACSDLSSGSNSFG